jgi:hypothetical protein
MTRRSLPRRPRAWTASRPSAASACSRRRRRPTRCPTPCGLSFLDSYDRDEEGAHLYYLRTAASGLVFRHRWLIRDAAQALLRDTVLDGATVARMVTGSRCVCHPSPAYWRWPAEDPVPDPGG